MIGWLAAWTASAYVQDVIIRPSEVARAARAAADARGKPLLNVGAGTPGSSLRVAAFGPFIPGDVNCDLNGGGACGPASVCQCDAHALPYRSGQFGAVIASHVIEHVDDPIRALGELARVADEVFVITPAWWAPHTWLHPGHRWYRRDDGSFVGLWRSDSDAPGYLGLLT